MGIQKTTSNAGTYANAGQMLMPRIASAMTVSCWVKFLTPDATAAWGGLDATADGGMNLRAGASFDKSWQYWPQGGSVGRAFQGAPFPAQDVWINFITYIVPGQIEAFMDNVSWGTDTSASPVSPSINSQEMHLLGGNFMGSNPWPAQLAMAEWAWWEEELTPGDRLTLQTQAPPAVGKTMRAYYRLNDLTDLSDQESNYSDLALVTPGEFENTDHPVGPPPGGDAARRLIQKSEYNRPGLLST